MENMLLTLSDSQGAITLTVSKEIAERIKNDKTYAAYIMQQVRSATQKQADTTHCPASLSQCGPSVTLSQLPPPRPASLSQCPPPAIDNTVSLVKCPVETRKINVTQSSIPFNAVRISRNPTKSSDGRI
ncbi:hypothetical protein R3I93_016931 [Phoxinus phoxinus]|uniref:Uncharacterized protein n=1 Tax=Phoxinus phoxinus TaxID=58324 RepID=A0AAN9GXN2_9TELE